MEQSSLWVPGTDPEVRLARECLASARHIGFLGFGYHSVNITRLFDGLSGHACTITGTGYGLTDAERAEKAALISRLVVHPAHSPQLVGDGRVHALGRHNQSFTIDLQDRRNLDFLRNSPHLLRK